MQVSFAFGSSEKTEGPAFKVKRENMTQLESAKKQGVTPLMKRISEAEKVKPLSICRGVAAGKIVILNNKRRAIRFPCAVGTGLKTKVNANIGTSTDRYEIQDELNKLETAVKYGADTVMDLSVGGNLRLMRQEIIKRCRVPVGTVPIYEAAVNAQKKYGSFLKLTVEDLFAVLEQQAQDGVDFFTIHAGVTRKTLEVLKKNRRMLDIVSRGAAMLASWMAFHKRENPLFEFFERVLDIACRHDVTLSLGDGLRPGSILDATDRPQIAELKVLGELTGLARENNVQVMIEGPGHIPLNQVERNVRLEKKICRGAPFYVLGPLVTDIAAGYDHISSAIGAAVAGGAGADFLCYVTASEHLRHPTQEDVREGVVASKIAAHAADLVKGIKSAWEQDKKMTAARRKRDWQSQIKLSLDPDKAREYRNSSKPEVDDVCSMCGTYCSIKLTEQCLKM